MSHIEQIEWHKASDTLPDADTTVLMIPGGDVEAWIGFLDGDQWRFADAMPCENVIWWAHLPEGPKQ